METMDWEFLRKQTLRPFFSWDALVSSCLSMQGWDPERAQKAISAINYLRTLLEESFPETALMKEHPIGEFFYNNVPWTKEWWIWLARSIQLLNDGKSFDTVLRHFRSSLHHEFHDAVSLLHYGAKFKSSGFQVDFEQSVMNGREVLKYPDLKITDIQTDDIWYVEIPRLTKNARNRLYDSVIDRIIHGGIRNGRWLRFSGILHQPVIGDEFRELEVGIDQIVRRAAKQGTLQQWVHPRVQ